MVASLTSLRLWPPVLAAFLHRWLFCPTWALRPLEGPGHPLLTPGSGCCSLSPLPPPTPIAWMPMLLIFSDSFGAKFLEKKGREGRGGERNGGEKMRRNGKRDLIFLLQSSSFFLSYLFAIALITSYRHFKICISKTVPIFSLIKTPLYSSILLMGL